jgi:hydroxymethylpyrimidine/phosphomethylpyrimidine kinase
MSTVSPGRPVVLCIGGSDPIGASGLQADARHLGVYGVHATSAPTALTIQGVRSFEDGVPTDVAFFRRTLEAVFDAVPIDVVLIGMLATVQHVRTLLVWLHNFEGRIVLDPVLAASAGAPLLDEAGRVLVREALVVRADVVLPNAAELGELAGGPVAANEAERADQAVELVSRGAALVLAKGGHAQGPEVVDLLVTPAGTERLAAARVPGRFRGTGGALASACAAEIAWGATPSVAVKRARERVHGALMRAARTSTPFLHLDEAPPRAS